MARPRLLGGLDRATPRSRRRGPVPRQPRLRAPHGPRGDPLRRRARRSDALDRGAGQGRAGPRVEAGGQARARGGGRRAREVQATPPPRRAQARASRAPGGARARRRGRGAQAAAAARVAGDGRRARGEARRRDRLACGRVSHNSISPTRPRAAPTRRSGASRRRSRSALRRAGSKGCWRIAGGRRRSSRTQRGGARPPLRRATGSRVESSGSSSGPSPRPRCSSVFGASRRLPTPTTKRRPTPRGSSSTRSRLRRQRAAPSASGTCSSSAPISFASASARSSRRSRSRRGFPPQRALSPRMAPVSRLRRWRSSREPSGRSLLLSGRGRPQFSPMIPLSGLRSSSERVPRASGASRCSPGHRRRRSSSEYPVVALDALLDVSAPSVTAEGFGYDPARGELWFVGETAEAVLLELHGRRKALAAELAELEEQVASATRAAEESARACECRPRPRMGRRRGCERRRSTHDVLGRLVELRPALRDGMSSRSARGRSPRGAAARACRRGRTASRRARRGAAQPRRDRGDTSPGARRGEHRPHGGRGRDRAHRSRGERGDATSRVGRGRRRRPRVTTATSSRRASSGSRLAARRSARSIRSRARSTRPRRSG